MLRWLNYPRELPLSLFPDSLGSDPEQRHGLSTEGGVSGSRWDGLPAQDSVQSRLAHSTLLPLLFPAQVFCTSDPVHHELLFFKDSAIADSTKVSAT